jgi:hypothetical protein
MFNFPFATVSRDDAIPTLWLIALGAFVAVLRWWDWAGGIDELIPPVVFGFLFMGALTLIVGWAYRSAEPSITDVRFGVFSVTALFLVVGSISVEASLNAVGFLLGAASASASWARRSLAEDS